MHILTVRLRRAQSSSPLQEMVIRCPEDKYEVESERCQQHHTTTRGCGGWICLGHGRCHGNHIRLATPNDAATSVAKLLPYGVMYRRSQQRFAQFLLAFVSIILCYRHYFCRRLRSNLRYRRRRQEGGDAVRDGGSRRGPIGLVVSLATLRRCEGGRCLGQLALVSVMGWQWRRRRRWDAQASLSRRGGCMRRRQVRRRRA
mmetsp:Transcript_20554/g.48543  ORF Transcript_20554/g.48543 Transcript_20554/m.48543 type:complete len:201 (+) Transcript_20554:785-1387(+)